MPDRDLTAETWTQPEIVRTLGRIERKLDTAATIAQLEAFKADQLRKDTEQDKAIEQTEKDYNKLLLMIVGTALGAAASLLAALAPHAR